MFYKIWHFIKYINDINPCIEIHNSQVLPVILYKDIYDNLQPDPRPPIMSAIDEWTSHNLLNTWRLMQNGWCLQTTVEMHFLSNKNVYWSNFHWMFYLRFQSLISQDWFRKCLSTEQAIIQTNNGSPDRKVYRAHMGPIWGRQDPDGPHVGPMILAIWVLLLIHTCNTQPQRDNLYCFWLNKNSRKWWRTYKAGLI